MHDDILPGKIFVGVRLPASVWVATYISRPNTSRNIENPSTTKPAEPRHMEYLTCACLACTQQAVSSTIGTPRKSHLLQIASSRRNSIRKMHTRRFWSTRNQKRWNLNTTIFTSILVVFCARGSTRLQPTRLQPRGVEAATCAPLCL